jgi:DNA-binding transcriptional LysR family regulator
MLADADAARAGVQEIARLRRGRVRFGATPSLCTSLLPQVLHAYHRLHPGIQLVIQQGGSRDLVGELATGRLDLALIILPLQSHDRALATTELLREELVVASAHTAPPPGDAPQMRIRDLREHPLVMFRHGYDLREVTETACRAEGFEPSFAAEGGEMGAVLGLVEAGVGLAVLPSMIADRRPLRVTPIAPPGLQRTIGLAHRKDVQPPRAARELRRVLLEYLDRATAAGTLPPGTRPA